MKKTNNVGVSSFIVISSFIANLSFNVGCSESGTTPASRGAPPAVELPQGTSSVVLPKELKTVVEHQLYRYPEVTVLLSVKDAQITAAKIKAAGGKIVYDPNRGSGAAIGFLIADLPPEKVLDDDFVKSLDLRAITLENDPNSKIEPMGTTPSTMKYLSVPAHEIRINELRSKKAGRGLGEGVTVAVIDTGVDASHPAFQDRVVYWQDMTREGDFSFKATVPANNKVTLASGKSMELPDSLKGATKVYVGVMDEKAMGVQISEQARSEDSTSGLDINQNELIDDSFAVLAAVDPISKEMVAVIDVDGNGVLSPSEATSLVMDFNKMRKQTLDGKTAPHGGFVQFPSRNKVIKYPILFHYNEAGELVRGTFAADFESHGTHVAGIIGADGPMLQGASPKVNFMAMKVCSGISCTSGAIIRGLVESFYNPSGLTADIVNISLGSQQGFTADIYSYLIRDLAAKFGAVFFVSASNSGAGFRSINSLGHFGPIVSVGASVSRETLLQHYDVNVLSGAPEHSVFGFSSAGPNYTGQLRPNIVAPGSALSPTPLVRATSDMYNGTSMSSPLAAGGAAAILSFLAAEAETNADLKKAFDFKKDKIRTVLDAQVGQQPSQSSLIDFPLALRTSLEMTAQRLPNQTMLRQGYGLIRVEAAADNFGAALIELGQGPLGHTDFKMNDNKGENPTDRLFDRSVDIEPVKAIVLSIEEDAERPDTVSMDLFRNTPMTLRLKHVEVERPNGSVEILMDQLPFSIAVPGVEGQGARERQLLLGSPLKNGFLSVRDLSKMEAGVSYVAIYELFREGKRVLTLTDLVQKPFELLDGRARHSVPGIQPTYLQIPAAMSVQGVDIGANRNHRIPIAVRGNDQSLQVQAYFPAQVAGNILVQVYDVNGQKVGEQTTRRAQDTNVNPVPVNLTVKTRGKPGIYEVVISTSSGRFMGPTKYDLLVRALRFQPDAERLTLKTQDSKAAGLSSDTVMSITNTAAQVSKVTARVASFHRVESLNPFPVVPNRWTYKKLEIPAREASEAAVVDILVKFGVSSQAQCMSRIDSRLWKLGAGGEYEVAHKTANLLPNGKLFQKIPRPIVGQASEDLYVALETFACTPASGKGTAGVRLGMDVEAEFPSLVVAEGLIVKALASPSVIPGEPTVNVGGNRFLISVQAPKTINLIGVPGDAPPKVRARARIVISTDQTDISAGAEINLVQ